MRAATVPARGERLLVALIVAGGLALAFAFRHMQDDAYISFRYADHFAHGDGLVWNPGERVEGYTNFLWVLLMAIPLALGYDPTPFAKCLGILLCGLTLLVTWRLAVRVLQDDRAALVALVLLATNHTFASFATSGLETMLETFLLVTTLELGLGLLAPRDARPTSSPARLAGFSLVLALSLLTRLDSALLAVPLLAAVFVNSWRRAGRSPMRWMAAAALVVPLAIVVGPWLLWKLSFYGHLLPNTATLKLSHVTSRSSGLAYVALFVDSYGLLALLLLGVVSLPSLVRSRRAPLLALAGFVALWFGYAVAAGGDFMDFRFLVPALPALFIVIAWLLFERVPTRELRVVLVGVVLVGSLSHSLLFRGRHGIETVEQLNRHLQDRGGSWIRAGRVLGAELGGGPSPVIATSAAGAIPFYSRLPTVDMLGLCDAWVARHGVLTNSRPGHVRVAPLSYLVERGVHLVIGHPQVVRRTDLESRTAWRLDELTDLLILAPPPDLVPPDARVLEIPLDPERQLLAVYLRPNPVVDAAIRRGRWRSLPVHATDASPATPIARTAR